VHDPAVPDLTSVSKKLAFVVVILAWSSLASAQSLVGTELSDKAATQDSSAREALQSEAPTTRLPVAGVQPFGANLFLGGFANDREDGLNPDYAIASGDRISVRIFGAKNYSDDLTVDHQGNIFIPEIGPIAVRGVANRELNARVSQAISAKYKSNVKVYTSLNASQPVAVFVTGFVNSPGRFAGIPSNSVLFFLDRAGGIDHARGSFRNIAIQRNGRLLASFDLYDFILNGSIPDIQFSDGDTIVVRPRGGVVEASGAIRNPAQFEIRNQVMLGADIMNAALLDSDVTHVGLTGTRDGVPVAKYLPLERFMEVALYDGDQVSFRSDMHENIIVVELEGSFDGPSRYTVPPATRLVDLLDHIEVDPELADTNSISLRRKSIAKRQKTALNESLQRLETKYLTTTSLTTSETGIRTTDAELIGQFVERAREVDPSGRLVVASEGNVSNVLLQQGDVITIPPKTDSVLLSGEVMIAQAMLYDKSRKARDYIARSGGFTQQADDSEIIVVHANGEVSAGINPRVRPGDEIIVLPKVPVKNVQMASTIVDILYKVAVAASVALRL